jgi:sulfur-oxidizing protein SoxY
MKPMIKQSARSIDEHREPASLSRRDIIKGLAAGFLLSPAIAMAKIEALLSEHYGAAEINEQGMTLTMPTLAENGNSVPIKISFDSDEQVENLKVFAPENPAPLIAEFSFGTGQRKVEINSRMRLANSQTVMAVAQTDSGKLYAASAKTVITLAACVEPLL